MKDKPADLERALNELGDAIGKAAPPAERTLGMLEEVIQDVCGPDPAKRRWRVVVLVAAYVAASGVIWFMVAGMASGPPTETTPGGLNHGAALAVWCWSHVMLVLGYALHKSGWLP